MSIYSNLRRNIVLENNVYKVVDLFGDVLKETLEIDDPEFYNVETQTLKLGNLCVRETNKNETPTISTQSGLHTTYCSLLQLSNSLPKELQTTLHKDLDLIYNFLRRDLSIDNRRKFHNLIKVLMSYDNQANSINLVSNYIKKTNSADDISISLDLFRKKEVSELDIEKFLKQAKHTGYKEYERSFVGDHFKTNENKLFLRYKGEEETRSIYQIVKEVLSGDKKPKQAIGSLYQLIVGNYTPQDMVKGDLECIKPVYNENGDEIIDSGEIVEVKKLDHGGDSYLSEFFAIYKNSKIPKDALKPEFIKTYNTIIDGLYTLFSSSNNNILEDIKRNFAGIIYSENIFIGSDDIELYWSNKGRSSCSKDHRLSIRYRINKSKINSYVYQINDDVLLNKPINIKLDKDKILCPITTPKKTNESTTNNNFFDLLLEGRKEDILKKYGEDEETTDVINYFSEKDPSGNNKYLEWMFKNWAGLGKNRDYSPLDTEVVDVIELFHQNVQRVKNKDINSYSFKELEEAVKEAEEKRKMSELKKEAKKEKTIIYEDNKWLVVSPHSHKASCYYGAGTKWCVTMRNTTTHWNRYSKRASFFFIIDKTKGTDDPLYKVAYRKIGGNNRYELWDASDREISNNIDGRTWFYNLPTEIKERSEIYHNEKFPKGERPEWIDDEPRAQALFNFDKEPVGESENIYYGLPIFETVDGEYWVSADEGDMNEALMEKLNDYDDEDLIEFYDNDGEHLELSDFTGFISSEVDNYIGDLSDEEFLELSGYENQYNESQEAIESLEGDLENAEEEDIESIEEEIASQVERKVEILEESKEIIKENYKEDLEDCLDNGVVSCLIHDKGLYQNARQLLSSGLVELDRDELIYQVNSNYGYDEIAGDYGYDEEQDDDGDDWYVFQIDY